MPLNFQVIFVAAALASLAAGAATLPQASSAPSASAVTGETPPLDEVTVTAKRFELDKRVSSFVYKIAAVANQEGLPRWRKEVCPLVGGLSKEQGEYILGRVSDIARAAGVPLAPEKCRPNLFIVVTTDPKKLLGAMNLQTRQFMFGGALPTVVDGFIARSLPVRAWYKLVETSPEGQPMGAVDPVFDQGWGGLKTVLADTAYARINVLWDFSRVLLVVDQSRLKGLTRGQFADYIAMLGFADLKPGAQLGDAPSILKLFDGGPDSTPAGMSDWDQAFLKSLYATDGTKKGQRANIAQTMVHDIKH